MKRLFWMIIGVLAIPTMSFAQKAPKLETRADSISYALGMDIGKNLGELDLGISAEMLYKGLNDVYSSTESPITEEGLQALLMAFQQEAQSSQEKKFMAKAETAKQEGELFLNQNKSEEGVVVLPSGLQYKVLTPGNGPSPGPDNIVRVHYEGRFLDESVFDSSYERGTPAQFAVNQVIAGWTEALQLMNAGAKWRLFIPSDLAYGPNGYPPNIGPNETLIFEVELLDFQ
ncbi:MAG: FKBP-type peptidyl-prolyl cis-trans isomerase [Bacteroidia bacterium]|nr:FKBP-type peptidyl-prolyl cis-trans isomerase [Bacteroidia bacterium]